MIDLLERPLFQSPPGEDVVAEFRRHLAETSRPESFPQISTTKPPKDGQVVVLYHPIDINRSRRPDKDMAPCPICSANVGKYLRGGTLIWCEASHAIYAIGPDCSETLWEDGRLNRAVNVYLQAERTKRNAVSLVEEVRAIGARRTWIVTQRAQVKRLSEIHDSLAREAPKLRGALSRALRTATSTGVSGGGFLRGTWKAGRELDVADAALRRLLDLAGSDVEGWVENLAPRVVAEYLDEARRTTSVLKRIAGRAQEAAAFLSASNMERMAQWGRSGQAPMDFVAIRTGSSVDLRAGEERWRGPVGVGAIGAPP